MKKLFILLILFSNFILASAQESDFSDDLRTPAADPISEEDIESNFFDDTAEETTLDELPPEEKNSENSQKQLEDTSLEAEAVVPEETIESSPEAKENLRQEMIEEQQKNVKLNEEPLPLIKRKKEEIKSKSFRSKKIYIRHPLAKKGLIKINKDNVYIYKTDSSPQDSAASLRLGFFDLSNLQNKNGIGFSTVYQDASSTPLLLFDYEWQKWRTFLGKTGYKAGTGLFLTQGSGRFENGIEAPEQFTFVVFPSNIGLIHRFQFTDGQWFVPYVEGGADGIFFAEHRDDSKNPTLGAALGASWAAHFAGGASLSLTKWGWADSTELDMEYGINSLWLTIEFRALIALGGTFDFSSNIINAGILAEF